MPVMLRYGLVRKTQYNNHSMMDTIGQRLKKARKQRKLSLEKAAESTRIRQGYLQALEADDYSDMPSPVHARGFLRNYAQYLELDLDQATEELRAAHPEQKPGAEPPVYFEGEETAPTQPQEETPPGGESQQVAEEVPGEPFWQTWLRRTKSEIGELEGPEQPGSGLPSPTSAASQASATGSDRSRAPGAHRAERADPDPASKPEAAPTVENEAAAPEPRAERKPKPWTALLERVRSRIPRKQANPAPAVESAEKPELKPEPGSGPPPEPGSSSQEIINEIATQLRRRREMLSLTLEEIERHTRLRTEIMEALEKGNFDELPSPVQTRGMLANYAGFLDLEVDALLLRFADALQARHRERHPVKPSRRRGQPIIPENLPPFRTFIAGDVVFGIGMVLLLVGFSIWGISRVIALQSEQATGAQPEAGGPSISEALIGTQGPTVESEITLIPAEDTPIPSLAGGEATLEIPTVETNANVQINVVALERSFLQVTVDGELVFEGRTIPGNAYPFEGDESIEILAGNGSALRVIYNQRDMGLLGGFGQIASFIYTAEEVVTPTPAMSPTVTNTPFISPTPSITPSPTLTPSPTPTAADLPVDI